MFCYGQRERRIGHVLSKFINSESEADPAVRDDSAAIADASTAELHSHILGALSDVFVSGINYQNLRWKEGFGE